MVKATIKLLLKKNKANETGNLPVYLRVTIGRKTTFKSTGKYIPEKMWDPKNEMIRDGHPMAKTWNLELTNLKADAGRTIFDLSMRDKAVTASVIKEQLSGTKDQANIFDFADTYAKEVKHKREGGTIDNYTKHLKKLEEFNGSRALTFDQIDHQFLTRYEAWLHDNIDFRKKGNTNYVHLLLRAIRGLFNAAKKQKITDLYPFDVYELPTYSAPGKAYLSLPELERWEKYADAVQE
jgi:integrase/recombinase XerD